MHHRQQETASYTITATSAHGLQSAITNLVPSYPCLSLSSHFACSSKCFVAALTNCIITALTYCIITAHCIITVLSWTVFIAALCYRTDFFFPCRLFISLRRRYGIQWERVWYVLKTSRMSWAHGPLHVRLRLMTKFMVCMRIATHVSMP